MNHRHGSVLIYFIGLAAIVVIIAFAFLRSLTADAGAGDSSIRVSLAGVLRIVRINYRQCDMR